MHRGTKILYHWGAKSNWDAINCFSKTKWNPEVVSGFEKCLSLFGNRTKQERIYHCEITNHLVSILYNLATT